MDVFESFGETLKQFTPVLLAVPGGILTAAGLVFWLGGVRLLRPLAVFVAAGAGFACAWAFTSRGLVPLVGFVVILAAIALFLDKPVVVLLGGCMAGLAVLAFPLFSEEAVRQTMVDRAGAVPKVEDASVFEAGAYGEAILKWAAECGKAYWAELSDGRKTAAGCAMVCVLTAGAVAWRWICALTCSTLGTAMLLIGLTVLVLSKGSQTIPYLEDFRPYLWITAGGMIAAGTLLNRWLCPVKDKQSKSKQPQVQGDGK